MAMQLETPRLILRSWQASDLMPFYEMNHDVEVMRYFPSILSQAKSNELANLIQSYMDLQGWGFWALELKENAQFIGFTGLHAQPDQFQFSPCTEIGWRLKRSAWGQGFATEAAQACLAFGFNQLNLNDIVAFTAVQNTRSQAMMRRLGMSFSAYFDHPELDDSSDLKPHVLYRILNQDFKA